MNAGGTKKLQKAHSEVLIKLSKVLNIKWIEEAAKNEVDIICARSTSCPRKKRCDGKAKTKKISWINQVKQEIIKSNT